MKEISYAEDKLTTSDAVASAVMAYAKNLGKNADADTVEVPVVLDDRTFSTIEMLLGPASQLTCRPIHSGLPDPDGHSFVEELQRRTANLGHHAAAVIVSADVTVAPDLDEYAS